MYPRFHEFVDKAIVCFHVLLESPLGKSFFSLSDQGLVPDLLAVRDLVPCLPVNGNPGLVPELPEDATTLVLAVALFPQREEGRKNFWSSCLDQNIFLVTYNLFKFLAGTLSPVFSVLFAFVGHAHDHVQDHGPVPDHAPSHAPSHDHALSRRCSSPIEVQIEVQLHRVFSEYSFCFGSEVVTYVLSFIFLLQSIVCIEDVGRENR